MNDAYPDPQDQNTGQQEPNQALSQPGQPPQPGHMQPWTQYATPVPSSGAQQTMSQMTQRLQTVIDAAERAAQAIRYDAEEQARRHLAEAQRKADQLTAERVALISDLTDDLIRHAGVVRDRSEQMVAGLEDAINSVTERFDRTDLDSLRSPQALESRTATDAETEAPQPPAGPGDSVPSPPPPPSSATTPARDEAHTPASDDAAVSPDGVETGSSAVELHQDALLHATRLAVAGTDRGAIVAALREEFGVVNPEPILERVLGGD